MFCINFGFWPQKSPKQSEPRKNIIWELRVWKLVSISPVLPLQKHWCLLGLPRWLSGKESACRSKRCRFNFWVREIPWRRKWQPPPIFLPGKFHWFLLGELISEFILFHVDHFKSLYSIFFFFFYKWLASVLYFGFFSYEAYGILLSRTGIKITSPALEGEVLTTAREVPLC